MSETQDNQEQCRRGGGGVGDVGQEGDQQVPGEEGGRTRRTM